MNYSETLVSIFAIRKFLEIFLKGKTWYRKKGRSNRFLTLSNLWMMVSMPVDIRSRCTVACIYWIPSCILSFFTNLSKKLYFYRQKPRSSKEFSQPFEAFLWNWLSKFQLRAGYQNFLQRYKLLLYLLKTLQTHHLTYSQWKKSLFP